MAGSLPEICRRPTNNLEESDTWAYPRPLADELFTDQTTGYRFERRQSRCRGSLLVPEINALAAMAGEAYLERKMRHAEGDEEEVDLSLLNEALSELGASTMSSEAPDLSSRPALHGHWSDDCPSTIIVKDGNVHLVNSGSLNTPRDSLATSTSTSVPTVPGSATTKVQALKPTQPPFAPPLPQPPNMARSPVQRPAFKRRPGGGSSASVGRAATAELDLRTSNVPSPAVPGSPNEASVATSDAVQTVWSEATCVVERETLNNEEMEAMTSAIVDVERSQKKSMTDASKWFEASSTADTGFTQRLAMVADMVGAVGSQLEGRNHCEQGGQSDDSTGLFKLIATVRLYAKDLVGCDRSSVFLKVKDQGQYMLTTTLECGRQIAIPIDSGIAGAAVSSRSAINVPDVSQDPRWNPAVDWATGYTTKSILCVPILRQKGDLGAAGPPKAEEGEGSFSDVLGVLQVINKLDEGKLLDSEDSSFSWEEALPCKSFQGADLHIAKALAALTAIWIQVGETVESEHRNRERLTTLSSLVRTLAEVTTSNPQVIQQRVRLEAARLCRCDLAVVLMLDESRESFSADLPDGKTQTLRIPPTWAGDILDLQHHFLAASVVRTGQKLIVGDLPSQNQWQHVTEKRRFDLDILRSAIALPIYKAGPNGEPEVVGVLEVFNKISTKGRYVDFDTEDIELLEGLCAYAVSAVATNSDFQATAAAYKMIDEASLRAPPKEARLKRALTSTKLFSQPQEEESKTPASLLGSQSLLAGTNLLDWDFDATAIEASQLSGLICPLFSSWSLQESFGIADETLNMFCDKVNAGYFSNPFHNYHHAWSVLQACNHILFTLGREVTNLLSKVDLLSLMVAAICHDIGHPGTTNTFQQKICSPLALFYNDISILENHHAATCFQLMSDNSDANVLANLCQKDFRGARRLICRSILSTDMSVHERDLARLRAHQHKFSKESEEDREMLVSSFLHAADLSNPCREPDLAEKWARLLAQEFKLQTEEEAKAGIEVSGFMLNGYQESTEIFFINTFVQPLWDTMATNFAPLRFYADHLHANLQLLQSRQQDGSSKDEEEDDERLVLERGQRRRRSFAMPDPRAVLKRPVLRQAATLDLDILAGDNSHINFAGVAKRALNTLRSGRRKQTGRFLS